MSTLNEKEHELLDAMTASFHDGQDALSVAHKLREFDAPTETLSVLRAYVRACFRNIFDGTPIGTYKEPIACTKCREPIGEPELSTPGISTRIDRHGAAYRYHAECLPAPGEEIGRDCVVCGIPIQTHEARRGMGDGSGTRYAHEACYWRDRAVKAEQALATMSTDSWFEIVDVVSRVGSESLVGAILVSLPLARAHLGVGVVLQFKSADVDQRCQSKVIDITRHDDNTVCIALEYAQPISKTHLWRRVR